MVTPTPASPDGGEPTGPAPRQEALATVAAQIAAIDELIGLAKLSIRVYDIDLSRMGWNDPARARSLAAFLRASPAARLEIIVQDTGWIERSCPRLTQLLKYHGHAIAIKRSGVDARAAMDPLMIVDGVHYLHRFNVAQPRAALSIGDPAAVAPLLERFDAISETSEPGISSTTLGL
jgi:hypothetical protein